VYRGQQVSSQAGLACESVPEPLPSLACADKGRIKSYKLEWSEQSGVALGWKLVLRGELNVVSDGIPEPDWEPVGALTVPAASHCAGG
jgi:hypothetical protein